LVLELPPTNYQFIHDRAQNAISLGVMENGSAGTLEGGITARTVLVEYDASSGDGAGRVGMVVTDCGRLLEKHHVPGNGSAAEGNTSSPPNPSPPTISPPTPSPPASVALDAASSETAAGSGALSGALAALVLLAGACFAGSHYGRRAGWLDDDSDGGGALGAALRTAAQAVARGKEVLDAKWNEVRRFAGTSPTGYAKFGLDVERPRGEHGVELPPLLPRR